uniref:G protein signaling modulator 1b n=1 Tax=Anabas testudineus TaxID=64144 RepID=A0A7N6C0T9_ANATE
MPVTVMASEPCPLTGAERAMCRLVHHGPRPQAMLRPLHLELQVYVDKTRSKQKMEASCLELALEGERLCKAGDFKGGTAFFEAAVQVGTEDLKTLSAIYSQLGNAYFYLKEYGKALEYHKHDLTLARTIGDRIGEGKASGNLGNTLKVLGRFDEAVVCCQRHLDISQEQGDKVGEARALYNIGNVFHAKGKQQLWGCTQEPGDLPLDVRDTLQRATGFYEMNLCLVKELGDRAAQGRAYGNLGNTHYLLGNFVEAIKFHRQRLSIAKEFGDKAAERRAYSNLGNALIFLGQFNTATEYYRKTLQLSRQLRDQVMEAQACYSLGNTYTLLQQYERAIDYHLKHLHIAQELNDRWVGEGRACWSLGNAYVSLGNHKQALHYARKHLDISKEIGDRNGELTARMNVEQLMEALGVNESDLSPSSSEFEMQGDTKTYLESIPRRSKSQLSQPGKRKGYPDSQSSDERQWLDSPVDTDDITVQVPPPVPLGRDPSDEDCFFDLLSKFQSSRMDDQRCHLDEPQNGDNGEGASNSLTEMIDPAITTSPQTEELFDLIASSQSRRLDDQRVNVGNLPGLRITHNNLGHLVGEGDHQEPSDDFFNMLIKCQSSRIDDQRCSPPEAGPHAPTVPDEDFFSLIQRVQAKRMDEQRVQLPTDEQDSPQSPEPPGGFTS